MIAKASDVELANPLDQPTADRRDGEEEDVGGYRRAAARANPTPVTRP